MKLTTKIKKMKRKTIGIMVILFMAVLPFLLPAQNPPMPNGGNDPPADISAIGGGASLGGGIITMLTLALGYGVRKIYDSRRRILE